MINKTAIVDFIENRRKLLIVDFILVIAFIIFPLFISLPYRVNIFLSWEGAYRLYLGQVPFKDFGLPMGFGYWLVPTLFFKLLGPTFMSLIKAQVLINFVSAISLRSMLYNLKVNPFAVTLTLLIFCLTYVIYNFWPWYNHSVVAYELVALCFLTGYRPENSKRKNIINLGFAGFFTFISFYTKQDVGALCFVICLFLIGYSFWLDRKVLPVIVYLTSFLVTAGIFIIPFLKYDFTYWFNLGQAPHNSRISAGLLLSLLLSQSTLEKIYLLLIAFGLVRHFASWKQFIENRSVFICSVISVALILQSLVTRASSPLPTDHMSYFHTFAFAGISLLLPWNKWNKTIVAPLLIAFILFLTFSEGYWKYVSGFIPTKKVVSTETETESSKWVKSKQFTMQNVTLPEETQQGIDRIMALPFLKKENLKVLNMSELTPLAHEIGYTPLTNQPLWYHLNIGMFQKEVDAFTLNIRNGKYDLVLFERIPSLTEFYPMEVWRELKKEYIQIDTFLAPRKLEDSHIDVFVHPDLASAYQLSPIGSIP